MLRLILFLCVVILSSACSTIKKESTDPCLKSKMTEVDVASCHDQSFLKLNSSPREAIEQFQILCDKHNLARACSNYAFQFEDPKLPNQLDLEKAYQYYVKACDLKDGVGCNNLANMLIKGQGVKADEVRAVVYLQKSCQLDFAQACFRVAIITSRGILLKNDDSKVVELMTKGCRLNDFMSCHDLGYYYLDGKGVARDLPQALDLFSLACNQGLARGCGSLGSLYLSGGAGSVNYSKAYELLQRACDGDDGPSCSNLGYMIEEGKGSEANPKQAAQYYSKACQAGDALGCGNLGALLAQGKGVEKNDVAALPNLEKGCSDKVAESCRHLDSFHEEGRAGIPKSKSTALFYRKRACEYGDDISCVKLVKGLDTLCQKTETQVLACQTGLKRMFSLCIKSRAGKASKLVYRFGQSSNVELEYSGEFKYLNETWAIGEKNQLSFSNANSRYVIGETLDKSLDPPVKHVQVKIDNIGKLATIDCQYPILGSLNSVALKNSSNITKP